MTTYETIQDGARLAREHFHTKTRDSGEDFIAADAKGMIAPRWIRDLCHTAHDNGAMLPDDLRYRMIVAALDHIIDDGDDDDADGLRDKVFEWADLDVEIYNSSLAAWLGSHATRASYCDDAMEQAGSVWPESGIWSVLQMGYAAELCETYEAVIAYLDDHADEDLDESTE